MRFSEFREDIVSGEWILIAPGRSRRPREFAERARKRIITPVKECPFENPAERHTVVAVPGVESGNGWRIMSVMNMYPAVRRSSRRAFASRRGPYALMRGVGHHELIITRDHRKNFPQLSPEDAVSVFQMLRECYRALAKERNTAFISIFHNWGPLAGASVYHPHYQVIAIPVIPPDIGRSLRGSAGYFHKHGKCVHCVQLAWEQKEKKRIIFETDSSIAVAPFVSRNPFEVRIFPKRHLSRFEETPDAVFRDVAFMLQRVLGAAERKLNDPDYNFFIHTAPTKNKWKYEHYHWHIEIYPKLNTRAGFEFSTGIEINQVDPDDAARTFRLG